MSYLDDSVYEDFRGKIERCEMKDVKFNVLFTKIGMFRSGDCHPVKQFDLILSGKVEITLRENDKDIKKIYYPNQVIIIPQNTPHLFKFLEDTVMIEWWGGPFKAEYYKPYRDKVEEQINKHDNNINYF